MRRAILGFLLTLATVRQATAQIVHFNCEDYLQFGYIGEKVDAGFGELNNIDISITALD